MKYLMFILGIGLFSISAMAQQSGVILFEKTIHFELKSDKIPQGLNALMPKEIPAHFRLYYSADATLYEPDDSLNNLPAKSSDDFGQNVKVSIHINQSDERYYLNIHQHRLLHQNELLGRLFLIPDERTDYQWKLTGKQKMILGFPCNEAVLTNDTLPFKAWFTSKIPVASGPEGFCGLPGMILELNLGKDLTIQAKEIRSATPEDMAKVSPPVQGKKISLKAFEALKARKMKDREMNRSNQRIMIQQY